MHHRLECGRQIFGQRNSAAGGLGRCRLFAQIGDDCLERHPVRQLRLLARQHQQCGADDRLGIAAGVFQRVSIQTQAVGQPERCANHLRYFVALGQLGLVVGQAAQ